MKGCHPMISLRTPLVVVIAGLVLGVSPRVGSTSPIPTNLGPEFALAATGLSLQQCHPSTSCGGPGCVKIPTSLVPVNTNVAGGQWEAAAGGNCGTWRCFLIFRCPCGPPLSTGACI